MKEGGGSIFIEKRTVRYSYLFLYYIRSMLCLSLSLSALYTVRKDLQISLYITMSAERMLQITKTYAEQVNALNS
jgi:hypothetical protein